MKRSICLILVVIIAAFGLAGCKYVSSFVATGHVYSNDYESASVSFDELEGKQVFRFVCDEDKTAKIQYSGKLGNGNLTVYCDCNDKKEELFSLQGGDDKKANSKEFTTDVAYIIIETNGKCQNGACDFKVIYN